MKILATNGAGFIGSAVVRRTIKDIQGTVVNVDKLTHAGNLESLAEVSGSNHYYFEHTDICDKSAMKRVLITHKPDVVMYLAVENHVDRSTTGSAALIETNIIGTYILLEAARGYWNELDANKKQTFCFHHVSTDEVYNDLPHPDEVVACNVLPLFTEKTACAPGSPYPTSKVPSGHLVRVQLRICGFPIIVTNCSNNHGPYHLSEKLILLAILNALEGKTLPIYGKGGRIRDWFYVEGHARTLHTMVVREIIGETYNVDGHNKKKSLDVIRTICDLLDVIVSKGGSYREQVTYVTDRPGHDRRYATDAAKISDELDWKPLETFKSGIRKTVQWYLANQGWVKNVGNGAYASWLPKQYGENK